MKYLTFFLLATVVANAACRELPDAELLPGNIVVPEKREVEVKKMPYYVRLSLEDDQSEVSWCAGSLINHKFVLTAAHCTQGIERATVYLGSTQRESGEVTHKVNKTNIIIHPKWDEEELVNDISLIRIPHTKYSEKIRPVKLPAGSESKESYLGEVVITSGYGHMSNASAGVSDDLQWSFMGVITNDECSESYGTAIRPSHICIKSYGGLSTCRGDTGGPLVLDSKMTQIGISSFGPRKGCERGTPSAFTRVSRYLGWIKRNLRVKK